MFFVLFERVTNERFIREEKLNLKLKDQEKKLHHTVQPL